MKCQDKQDILERNVLPGVRLYQQHNNPKYLNMTEKHWNILKLPSVVNPIKQMSGKLKHDVEKTPLKPEKSSKKGVIIFVQAIFF